MLGCRRLLFIVAVLPGVVLGYHPHHPRHRSKRQPASGAPLKWCGKNYQVGSPLDTSLVEPGHAQVPPSTPEPVLDFRCTPAIQPYLDSDTTGTFIVDANITNDVGQAIQDPSSSKSSSLSVSISLSSSSSPLTTFNVQMGSTGTESPSFSLSSMPPSTTPYNVTCTATLHQQTFQTNATVHRLPANPYGGSTTKTDRRTGAILRQTNGNVWEPILPFGFYTFAGDVAANLSVLNAMKGDGWNVVHLIPPYPATNVLTGILDAADAAGLTYVPDFRDIYQNASAMTPLIQLFRSRKGLLTWYTADEPDGTHDPYNWATDSYNLIYSMDGYHPVSLVLNCADFFWSDYVAGTDIVFSDTYPIGCNTTFSKQYHTPCNATYGCCGCDDCVGDLADISNRFDIWSERRRLIGRSRDLSMWNVPQAFDGTAEQWTLPTPAEVKLQTILGTNHGAFGIIPWDNPYASPPNPGYIEAIYEIAPIFAQSLAPVIGNHTATRSSLQSNASNVDIAMWTVPVSDSTAQSLIMFANLNYAHVVAGLETSFDLGKSSLQNLFGQGNVVQGKLVVGMDSTGVAGFLVQHPADSSSGGGGKGGGKNTAHKATMDIWRCIVVAIAVGLGTLC